MKFKWLLMACLSLLLPSTLRSETLIDIDFSNAAQNVQVHAKGSFSGPLPAGVVADYPSWNASEVFSQALAENGRAFLRFSVKKLDTLVLFKLDGPKIAVPGYYQVKIVCRCPDSPLNAHIRIIPHPYTTLDEGTVQVCQEWKEQSFILRVENQKPHFSNVLPDVSSLGLYLSLKAGVTDIASVTLVRSDRAAYIAEAKVERPLDSVPNFFRNSRFPLGMQAGWSVNRDNVFGRIDADTANPGPSGAPSLRIHSEEPVNVYSEPFQVRDTKAKCHVSFSCQSKGVWYAAVGDAIAGIPASDKWQTIKLSFTPDPLKRGFALTFGGRGTLNVDSLMAWSGDGGGNYVSAGDCEIALALADSELSGTRLLFGNEPVRIKFCATGEIDGAILKSKAVNLYGEERPLPDIKLGRSVFGWLIGVEKPRMESGELNFEVFREAPLGSFRVEAWAERDGKRISPFNEMVFSRIQRPLHWGEDAPNSPFGGHFLSDRRTLMTMKAAGVNWERCNDTFLEATGWGNLEPEKNKWTFADEKIARYREAKIKMLGYLGTAPTWASYYPGYQSFPYFDLLYQPKDLDAFRTYVRRVAARYQGVIDEYQFQNEPWNPPFWHKGYDRKTDVFDQGGTPAKDYAKLSKIAYEELKKANPEAVMYGFNSADDQAKWTKAVFDAGAYPFCDMVDYHHYNGTRELSCIPGDGVEKAYAEAIGYIKNHATPPLKPIVHSEGNPRRSGAIPSKSDGADDGTGLYKHTLTWTSKDDSLKFADMTCRFVISDLALGVKRIFLYSDHCYDSLLIPPSFTVLLGADGYPHPALSAFSNMAVLLEGRQFKVRVPVGANVWAYIFEGRNASVAVISGTKDGSYALPTSSGLRAVDLFGNALPKAATYEGRIFYVKSEKSPAALASLLNHQ
jgi:hypothetical protein